MATLHVINSEHADNVLVLDALHRKQKRNYYHLMLAIRSTMLLGIQPKLDK